MNIGDLACDYMGKYEGTEVKVMDHTEFNNDVVAFDLTDGTHWFADNNDTCQVAKSLCSAEDIGFDDEGYYIVTGVERIEFLEG